MFFFSIYQESFNSLNTIVIGPTFNGNNFVTKIIVITYVNGKNIALNWSKMFYSVQHSFKEKFI